MPDRALDRGGVDGADQQLGMRRIEVLRHLTRVLEFAEGLFPVTERERLQRGGARSANKTDHGARVDSTRQEGADWHVAHHMIRTRALEEIEQCRAAGIDVLQFQGPITRHPGAAGLGHEQTPRQQFVYSLEEGVRGGSKFVPHEVEQPLGVQFARHEWVGEQRLDLGGEADPRTLDCVVERLQSQPVACQHQPPAAPIPQPHSEHASEMLYEVEPILLVGVHDGLGVSEAAKHVSLALQART